MNDGKDLTVVGQAKKRYDKAMSYYSYARSQFQEDYRFVMGDSENLFQWPQNVLQGAPDDKVMLTVNITAQHVNQVVNNIRMNRPQGKVIPSDSRADKQTAMLLEGWMRSIMSATNADECSDNAAALCIRGGVGYSWVVTEFEGDDSFNQVIREYPIRNSLSVLIDPNAKQLDKSDAEWGMVLEEVPTEEIKQKYKDIDPTSWVVTDQWLKNDTTIVCNYYYCDYQDDILEQYQDGSTGYKSENQGQGPVKTRKVKRKEWWWCKLVGGEDKPVSKDRWLGDCLPIITVVGEEFEVDGRYDCKGMVRDLKDTGRMVNYAFSSAVEAISLQPKAPYIASIESTRGYEQYWDNANNANYGRLPYNELGMDGHQLTMPRRVEPTQQPIAQLNLLEVATNQAKAASGQQNANFGIRSNETSGVAIQRQKAQGELATFHYPDNLARALRYRMKVYVDLAPKIYNEQQVVRILAADGSEQMAQLQPGLGQAYKETQHPEIRHLFDPTVGKYDVDIDVGASYQTQRQEAAAALTEMIGRDPALMQTHGDLVFKAYDWPMSDEMAKRSEKVLPPGLKDAEPGQQSPPPEMQQAMQQMQQQMQEMDDMLAHAKQEMGQLQQELSQKDAAVMQAQAKATAADIQAKQASSLLTIAKAEHSLASKTGMKRGEDGAMEEPDDDENYRDPQLDALLWKIEEANDKQSEMLELMVHGQAAIAEALTKPKQAVIKIDKRPDGSYVGTKTED
jgi:Phage P22-like portal protein